MITASVGAFGPSDTLSYNISKMADIALVRNLAMEWGKGDSCKRLVPGLIRTDFAKALWDNPEAAQLSLNKRHCVALARPMTLRALRYLLHRMPVLTSPGRRSRFVVAPICSLRVC